MTASYHFAYRCDQSQHADILEAISSVNADGYEFGVFDFDPPNFELIINWAFDKNIDQPFVTHLLSILKRCGIVEVMYSPVGEKLLSVIKDDPSCAIGISELFEHYYPTLKLSENQLLIVRL